MSCSTTPYPVLGWNKSKPEVWALLFGGADRSASCLPVPSHRVRAGGLLSAHPPSHCVQCLLLCPASSPNGSPLATCLPLRVIDAW